MGRKLGPVPSSSLFNKVGLEVWALVSYTVELHKDSGSILRALCLDLQQILAYPGC